VIRDEGGLTGRPRCWLVWLLSKRPRLAAALTRFGDYVQQETLSLRLEAAAPPAGAFTQEEKLDGVDLLLSVCRS
jgi:hypothetical protein